jgi:hypothetical protein
MSGQVHALLLLLSLQQSEYSKLEPMKIKQNSKCHAHKTNINTLNTKGKEHGNVLETSTFHETAHSLKYA